MSPILDSIGSVKAYGWGSFGLPSPAFESIATASLTGTQSTITIDNIPATFQHLQLRMFSLGTSSAPPGTCFMELNNDTNTNNYHTQLMGGYDTTTTSGYLSPGGSRRVCVAGHTYGGIQPTYPHISIVDFLDYSDTSQYKTIKTLMASDNNATNTNGGETFFDVSVWKSTSAISKLYFFLDSGSFAANTKLALYGIKD